MLPPSAAPGEVWNNQNPSPAAAGAPGETSAGWKAENSLRCRAAASPEPLLRQEEHPVSLSCATAELLHTRELCVTRAGFLYLRRTRGSSGGPGDQHLEMCRTSRFPETLGPGRSPGVKGRMGKPHRNTIRGKRAPREMPRAEHTWVIPLQEMQNGSAALPAGAGQLLLALVHGFFRSNWPDLSQT